MNIFIEKLRRVVNRLLKEDISPTIIQNTLKEHLHYPILSFVYNHPEYKQLIMYGGTALRICHDLPRMSEDLDFETNQRFNWEKFKDDLENHFSQVYSLSITVTIKAEKDGPVRTAFIKFDILTSLGLVPSFKKVGKESKKLHIRFDVHTTKHKEIFETEVVPIVRESYAFAIKTYPIATLMASKILAVLRRNIRNTAGKMTNNKARDIYDLIWYMKKQIIPNMRYLKVREIEALNILQLFKELSQRIESIDDRLFKAELNQFFYNSSELDIWILHWKEKFIILRDSYKKYEINELISIRISFNGSRDIYTFHFDYSSKQGRLIRFVFTLTYEFYQYAKELTDQQNAIPSAIKNSILPYSEKPLTVLEYEYAGLFYKKIQQYLENNDHTIMQPEIRSKIIRYTTRNIDPETQILLNEKLLQEIHLEELL